MATTRFAISLSASSCRAPGLVAATLRRLVEDTKGPRRQHTVRCSSWTLSRRSDDASSQLLLWCVCARCSFSRVVAARVFVCGRTAAAAAECCAAVISRHGHSAISRSHTAPHSCGRNIGAQHTTQRTNRAVPRIAGNDRTTSLIAALRCPSCLSYRPQPPQPLATHPFAHLSSSHQH